MATLRTLSEAETVRRRAVTGLRNFGRNEEADRYDAMSPREYAQAMGIELVENPMNRRRYIMAKSTAELKREITDPKGQVADLEDENEDLQDQLDEIAQIAAGDDENHEDEADESCDEPGALDGGYADED
jgi:hypothetical protein